MNPHHNPGLVILILFHLAHKVAAVNKGKSIAAAVILTSSPLTKNRKRIVLVAGSSPEAPYILNTVGQGISAPLPFHRMTSVKMNKIIVGIHKIHRHRHDAVQINGILTLIDHLDCPCNNILFFKNRVTKHNRKLRGRVRKPNLQSVHPILLGSPQGGEASQGILARINLMLCNLSHKGIASVPVFYFNAAQSIIAASIARKFLR